MLANMADGKNTLKLEQRTTQLSLDAGEAHI
jgi:hypothetical protein